MKVGMLQRAGDAPPGGRELGKGEGSGVQEAAGLVLRGSQARGHPGSVLRTCGICFFTQKGIAKGKPPLSSQAWGGQFGGASGQGFHLLQRGEQENGTLCPLGCFTCVTAAPRVDFLGLCHQKEPEPVPELVPELVPEPCLRAEHPSRCRAPRQGSPGTPEQEICL